MGISKFRKNNMNKMLISSIAPWTDIVNGKDCRVNTILEKLCLEDNFLFCKVNKISEKLCLEDKFLLWTKTILNLNSVASTLVSILYM